MFARHFVQKDEYSCTASVLRYALYLLTGETITKKESIELTQCKPNGTTFDKLQKVFDKVGLKTGKRRLSRVNMLYALTNGNLIVINDINTWVPDDHAVLLFGYKNKKVYMFDSYTKRGIRIKRPDKILENATEMFEVYK